MALHTKSEFAKLCGIHNRHVSMYVKRGKIILNSDGNIDSSLDINRDFIETKTGKKQVKQSEQPQENRLHMIRPDPGTEEIPEGSDSEEEEQDDSDDVVDEKASGYALSKKKLILEIKEKKHKIALLKLREDKLTGEIIPIEQVKNIFAQHSKAGAVVVKNTIDNILTRVAQMSGLNVNQIAELRGVALQEINSGLNKTVEETRKRVNILQMQHSERKEVGERN